jgi:hypothetical protein
MTADELIAEARTLIGEHDSDHSGDGLEAYVSVIEDSSSERSLVLASCEVFWGHGAVPMDDQCGAMDEGGHTYRVDRWIVETDERGDRTLQEFGDEAGAREYLEQARDAIEPEGDEP